MGGKKDASVYIKGSSGTNGQHVECFLYSFMEYNKYFIKLDLLLAKLILVMLESF